MKNRPSQNKKNLFSSTSRQKNVSSDGSSNELTYQGGKERKKLDKYYLVNHLERQDKITDWKERTKHLDTCLRLRTYMCMPARARVSATMCVGLCEYFMGLCEYVYGFMLVCVCVCVNVCVVCCSKVQLLTGGSLCS